VIPRTFDATRDVVFAAWTDPRHVPRWMLGPPGWSMPVCRIDLRKGGAWRFVWRKAGDGEMAMDGVYLDVQPLRRIAWTERWGPEWPETRNELVLEEHGGRTTSILTVTYPTKAARNAALGTGMKDGLDTSYARLDTLAGELA
jgi:uncharacterized protein YndB with AHSA1/START domain